jgi:hypothetical protein
MPLDLTTEETAAGPLFELHITVSEMSDWRYEVGIAIHEFVEAMACKHAGGSEQAVTTWHIGPGKHLDEPGDDP